MLPPQHLMFLFLLLGPNYVSPAELWPAQALCPKGWLYRNTHCYYFSNQTTDWDSARAWCRANMGSELASVNSPEENSYLNEQVSGASYPSAWLGLHDYNDGASWHWLDGTVMEFTNWCDGEPSNDNNNKHCGELRTDSCSHDGEWSDRPCSEQNGFICKMTVKTCPDLWTYHEGQCYYASSIQAPWTEAREACREVVTEADLVSIHSEEEDSFFADMLNHTSASSWLGLRIDSASQLWAWSDGSNTDYMNWNEGEPSDDLHSQVCAAAVDQPDSAMNGRWKSANCSESRAFGCKFSPTHVVGCEDGWASFGRYCYYYSRDGDSNTIRTYSGAREMCQGMDAHLVSIHNAEENDFVFSIVNGYDATATWIGLTDEGHQDVLSWSDGSPVTYTHWSSFSNDPFLKHPVCGRFTTVYELIGLGPWNLDDCDVHRYYICKKPEHPQLIHPANTGCTECSSLRKRSIYFQEYPWIPQDLYDSRVQYSDLFLRGRFRPMSRTSPPYLRQDRLFPRLGTYPTSRFRPSVFRKKNPINIPQDVPPPSSPSTEKPPSGNTPTNAMPHNMTQPPLTPSDKRLPTSATANRTEGSIHEDTITPVGSLVKNCELGDEGYEDSCYSLPGDPQTWAGAEAECQSRGAHLVVLNDRFESAFVSAYLGGVVSRAWIGLSSSTGDDGSVIFSWVNGDPVDYTDWDLFEPSPDHGTCVAASGKKSKPGFWSVEKCKDQFQFVCEYDREGYTPLPTVPSTGPPPSNCADGWDHAGHRCYKVFPEPLSWEEGEQWCTQYGSHLASVGSADEQATISELLGSSEISGVYSSIWVGLVLGSDLGYHWTDGTALDSVNWAAGQPDTHNGREDCGSADLSTMKLSDTVCGAYLPYVCEAPEGTTGTTVAPPTKVPDTPCDDDPSWLLYGNYCYKFVSYAADQDAQTWWDSHRLCQKEGAELASIHTYEENYWIESKISKLPDDILWVGGRSKVDSGYTWLDESPFEFVNWAKGEPNTSDQNCIGLHNHHQGYWKSQNCTYVGGSICKRRHGMTSPPLTSTQVPEGHCPQGWLLSGTKCMKVFADKLNFTSAMVACENVDERAGLVSVHSPLEQGTLTALIGTLNTNVWLGLVDVWGFEWLDQTPVTYTNWAAGEPSGHSMEVCVEAWNSTGQWNDVPCFNLNGYVCTMDQVVDIPSTNAPPPVPGSTYPPQGWSQEPLSTGYVFGIVMSVLLVVAGVGFAGYSYIRKKANTFGSGGSYAFDNALYFGGGYSSRVHERGIETATLTFGDQGDADA